MRPWAVVPRSIRHAMLNRLRACGITLTTTAAPRAPVEDDADFLSLCSDLAVERLFTTYTAIRHVVRNAIPGDCVECGVYQGRHGVMMARTLLAGGIRDRDLVMYDSFGGMVPPPGEHDYPGAQTEANRQFAIGKWQRRKPVEMAEVHARLTSTGYPAEHIHCIKGDVRETIPGGYRHQQIALLRLDTGFYESTRHELQHLYDLVPSGGVIIIDDYGRWHGAKKAVDDFWAALSKAPMLVRTDASEHVCVKP